MIDLKDGDILICRGHSLISNLIMKATHSTWSHSALYVEIWGQPSIIEAQKNGVNAKPFNVWVDNWGYEYEVFRHQSEFDIKKLNIRAFKKCGETSYDFVSFIIRQPFKLITGMFKYKGEKEESKRMICSEYTSWVWNLPNWYKLTPDDQYNYLSNSDDWINISKQEK